MKRYRLIKVRVALSRKGSSSHTHSFHEVEERGFTAQVALSRRDSSSRTHSFHVVEESCFKAQSRVVTIHIAGKKLALSSRDIDDAWNRIIKINK